MNNQAAQTMPELPHTNLLHMYGADFINVYTADQMRAYALAALTREAPTEGVGDVLEMRICETRHVTLRPNRHYVFTIDPNCEDCRAWNSYYPEDATPPAPQRLAQGEDRPQLQAVLNLSEAARTLGIYQAKEDAAAVAHWTGVVASCECALIATHPPHHDRGEVEQRARAIITDTIGFEFGHGEMQPVNGHDMENLAQAITAALTEAKQQQQDERWSADERPGDKHAWGDFSRNELIELLDQIADNETAKRLTKQQGPGEAVYQYSNGGA